MTMHTGRRRSGLLIPLFSCPSAASWGIGDIGDVRALTAWMAEAGQRVLQLLPLNEMPVGEQSPYSALTAMALDPIFICMAHVPEWAALGGEAALTETERSELAAARADNQVQYATVRGLKRRALLYAFDRFHEVEWRRDTPRANALRTFVNRECWWLDDYALFRALYDRESHRPWTEWPVPLRTRNPQALDAATTDLAQTILFYQYLQWIANTQWEAARGAARANGVDLFGDLPFMVNANSADVWANQHEFRLDASVGVPPDAFSATGQDWGMPAYRWEVVRSDDFRWLRERARRSAALFDGYRVDHLVGFYRTYSRPRDGGAATFSPATEAEQHALGERILQIFRGPGSEIIAEDLGTVPDFVRESLTQLAIPGFRVFRWERQWHEEGHPFRDPAAYPVLSVATSGTHDTETLAVWWNGASVDERAKVGELASVIRAAGGVDLTTTPFSPTVRDALLEAIAESASYLVILPIQDVFGWTARINEPATVTPDNWTFRLPWPIDRMFEIPEARERQRALKELTMRGDRL